MAWVPCSVVVFVAMQSCHPSREKISYLLPCGGWGRCASVGEKCGIPASPPMAHRYFRCDPMDAVDLSPSMAKQSPSGDRAWGLGGICAHPGVGEMWPWLGCDLSILRMRPGRNIRFYFRPVRMPGGWGKCGDGSTCDPSILRARME